MSTDDRATGRPAEDHAPDLTVTEARGAVRTGLSKILVISTGLAVVALVVVWLVVAH